MTISTLQITHPSLNELPFKSEFISGNEVKTAQSTIDGSTLIAATMAGTRHRNENKDNQDVIFIFDLPKPFSARIIVLADGAGSAKNALEGATFASKAIANYLSHFWIWLNDSEFVSTPGANFFDLKNHFHTAYLDEDNDIHKKRLFWKVFFKSALIDTIERIGLYAQDNQFSIKELATTITCVMTSPYGCAAVQIGDGAMVSGTSESSWDLSLPPFHGTHQNETIFLTSTFALNFTRFFYQEDVPPIIILFTDGLERLALTSPQSTPYMPFFRPFWNYAKHIETQGINPLLQLLTSSRLQDRTDDDITMVLISSFNKK